MLAGKIQHSHSQVDTQLLKNLEELLELKKFMRVLELPQLNRLASRIIVDGFSGLDVDIPDKEETTKSLTDNLRACKKSHTEGEQGGNQICSLVKTMNKCLEPIVEAVQKLLPENAKYVAKLHVEGELKLFEYACNAKDEEISELLNDCIREKLPKGVFNDEYYQKHKEEPLKTFKATPTKANLCKAMRHFTPMYTDPVKATCKDDVTVKAYNGYIEASLKYYCD